MGAEQSSPTPPRPNLSRPSAPSPPRPPAPAVAKAPGGPPIFADAEPSLVAVVKEEDSPSHVVERKEEVAGEAREEAEAAVRAGELGRPVSAPTSARDVELQPMPAVGKGGALAPQSDVRPQRQAMEPAAAKPPQSAASLPLSVSSFPVQQAALAVEERKQPLAVVSAAVPVQPSSKPVQSVSSSSAAAAPARPSQPSAAAVVSAASVGSTVALQPVNSSAHPLAAVKDQQEKKAQERAVEKKEERQAQEEKKQDVAPAGAAQAVTAVTVPAVQPGSAEGKQAELLVTVERQAEMKEDAAARQLSAQRRQPQRSSFLRFFLCGCGVAEGDAPPPPAKQPLPRSPPPGGPDDLSEPSLLPVVALPPPSDASFLAVQPVAQPASPAVAILQAPAPLPFPVLAPTPLPAQAPAPPAPIPAPVSSPVLAAAAASARIPVQPVPGMVHAKVSISPPVAVASPAIPVALPAPQHPAPSIPTEQKQPSLPSPALPSAPSSHPIDDTPPDRPQQLMHPVYAHLPLLRVDPSSLSDFPPHRPPVPDPSESRAFAAMRSLPLPKPLLSPYLLTSLTDSFIPSSTPTLAFQSSTDWSFSLYLDIVKACKQTGERFFDRAYPPTSESLFAHYEPRFPSAESNALYREGEGSYVVEETGTRWCRASEMSIPFNSFSALFASWELLHPTIRASDVKQGGLGTCYFVASVCSLVERDAEFVRSLFLTPDYSNEGVYQIRLCRNSVWTVVTIDDFLPCLTGSNTPRFTSAVDNQLWPALLEKAYSKLYGSYKALESGLPHEVMVSTTTLTPTPSLRSSCDCIPHCPLSSALHHICMQSDLTGCPAFEVSLNPHYEQAVGASGGPGGGPQVGARSAPLQFADREGELDILWLQLLEWKMRGWFFCCTCNPSRDEGVPAEEWARRFARVGLVTQHVYSLLDVVQEGQVRLVKLRNPWGRFVWRGRWAKGPAPRVDERKVAEEREAARVQQERARAEQQRQAAARAARQKTWTEVMKRTVKSIVDTVASLDDDYPALTSSSHSSSSSSSHPAPALPKPREDRGLFWMEWSDFTAHFTDVFICQFGDRWQEMRISDAFAPRDPMQPHTSSPPTTAGQSIATSRSATTPYYAPAMPISPTAASIPSTMLAHSMFELLVSCPTVVYLTLAQPDKRGEPPGVVPQPKYQPLGVFLLQSTNEASSLSSSTFSFVHSHFQLLAYKRPFPDRSVTCEALLPSITSRYLLLPEALLYGVQSLSYVLTIHADRPFYCRRMPMLPPALSYARLLSPPAGNLHSSLLSHYHCRVQEMRPFAYLITYSIPSGQMYIVQNTHESEHLHVSFDCTEGVRVLGSRAGGLCYDVVPPQSEQLVMMVSGMRRSAEHEKEGVVRVSYTYQFRREPLLQRFATRIAHHPPITGMDYHQPRRIVVTEHYGKK